LGHHPVDSESPPVPLPPNVAPEDVDEITLEDKEGHEIPLHRPQDFDIVDGEIVIKQPNPKVPPGDYDISLPPKPEVGKPNEELPEEEQSLGSATPETNGLLVISVPPTVDIMRIKRIESFVLREEGSRESFKCKMMSSEKKYEGDVVRRIANLRDERIHSGRRYFVTVLYLPMPTAPPVPEKKSPDEKEEDRVIDDFDKSKEELEEKLEDTLERLPGDVLDNLNGTEGARDVIEDEIEPDESRKLRAPIPPNTSSKIIKYVWLTPEGESEEASFRVTPFDFEKEGDVTYVILLDDRIEEDITYKARIQFKTIQELQEEKREKDLSKELDEKPQPSPEPGTISLQVPKSVARKIASFILFPQGGELPFVVTKIRTENGTTEDMVTLVLENENIRKGAAYNAKPIYKSPIPPDQEDIKEKHPHPPGGPLPEEPYYEEDVYKEGVAEEGKATFKKDQRLMGKEDSIISWRAHPVDATGAADHYTQPIVSKDFVYDDVSFTVSSTHLKDGVFYQFQPGFREKPEEAPSPLPPEEMEGGEGESKTKGVLEVPLPPGVQPNTIDNVVLTPIGGKQQPFTVKKFSVSVSRLTITLNDNRIESGQRYSSRLVFKQGTGPPPTEDVPGPPSQPTDTGKLRVTLPFTLDTSTVQGIALTPKDGTKKFTVTNV
ncbi:unnamed protein product, partial [Vitrella brassicaformis CCMP3155]